MPQSQKELKGGPEIVMKAVSQTGRALEMPSDNDESGVPEW